MEFLQLTITRMSVNSFLLKGWAVTLVSALYAFAGLNGKIEYIVITYISTITFWVLDGFYLSQERQFRSLYNHVRTLDNDKIDFSLDTRGHQEGRNTWFASAFSKTLNIFYGVMFVVTVVVRFLLN